jgi:hypothetical protein
MLYSCSKNIVSSKCLKGNNKMGINRNITGKKDFYISLELVNDDTSRL